MSLDGMPAFVIASFRYGASNSTQRSELVVSGRIAAIAPVPFLATDFSSAMALNVLFSCISEIDAAWACFTFGVAATLVLATEPTATAIQATSAVLIASLLLSKFTCSLLCFS